MNVGKLIEELRKYVKNRTVKFKEYDTCAQSYYNSTLDEDNVYEEDEYLFIGIELR